jgi:coproporphyrinogen III oxidase-like Fe-S oxidoreductase
MSNAPTVDAARWLNKFCRLYAKHDSSIYDWRLSPHISGLLLELDVDRGTIPLLIQRPGMGSCYAQTASMALSFHTPEGQRLPGNAEVVVLILPAITAGRSPTIEAPSPERIRAAQISHADAIHWGQFIAQKALITEDLYPHIEPLGQSVSDAEIRAGWVATVERIKNQTAPQQLGLYIHIPFCTVACTFCFCGKTDQFNRAGMETYLNRLTQEAESHAETMRSVSFSSVYFGGGTPSLLTPPAMRRMFEVLYGCFDVPDGTQIIYEGNPDSLSEAKIRVLADEGRVSRLTIGVQTLDDVVQAEVKRFNRPEQVADAVYAAKKAGITHVNCDLMAGLPKQSLASFQQDLEYLISLEPDSLHLNGFRPLPRTRLGPSAMSPERMLLRDQMLAWGTEALAAAGHGDDMGQGPRRTRNAANIQEYDLRRQNSSLLGLGFPARAHSFGSHYYLPEVGNSFDASLDRELAGDRRWRAIRSDHTEEMHKYLVSNLRTGFSRSEFVAIFGKDPTDIVPKAFEILENLGIIHVGVDEIYTNVPTAADDLIYRTFLYSPALMSRAQEVWGPDYDRSADYGAVLEQLMESCG